MITLNKKFSANTENITVGIFTRRKRAWNRWIGKR